MNISDHPGVQALMEWFGLTLEPSRFTKLYNIAPTTNLWTIVSNQTDYRLQQMTWGIVPPWAKPGKFSGPLINARSETIWEKPSFRDLIKNHRVIIPATGFYEWHRTKMNKTPYYIRSTKDHAFAFAGIYRRSKEGHWQCCIVTTDANTKMAKVHNRMPVILQPESMQDWIKSSDRPLVENLMHAYPNENIQVTQVSNYVNNSRNEGPMCVDPNALSS